MKQLHLLLLLTGYFVTGVIFTVSSQTITGTVRSSGDNQLLPGVTVQVKATSNGTTTNANGTYKLSEVKPDDSIVFSFVGFEKKTVAVDGLSTIDVVLSPDISSLDQVVVVGYGTQKKINLTGSVATISNKTLADRPLPTVGAVLSGLSPNLDIGFNGATGAEPGNARTWNIRGLGTLSGSNAPLVLIDGVEMNIQDLNPQDIESVSILKDASASAIYGSRAPFGVILITTKKGNKGGSPSIQYNGTISFGSPLGIGHRRSSLVFATVANQAAVNAGSAPNYPEEQMERIRAYMKGTYPYEYDTASPPSTIWAGRRVGNANYDFPYELLRNWRTDTKHSISVSGGTDKTQYYVSLGYFDEGSFYNYGYDDYKRYNLLANVSTEVTDWLSFGLNTKYAKSFFDYPIGITTVGRNYNFSATIYYTSPITPIRNPDGTLASPMLTNLRDAGRDKKRRNDFSGTLTAQLNPVKGWKTDISYSYTLMNIYGTSNPKPVWVDLWKAGKGNVGKPGTAYSAYFSNSPSSVLNVVTSYEKNLGNHYFKVLAGFEQREQFYTRLNGRGDDLITEEVPSISTAIGAITVDDTKWEWATQGVFARLNYNYKNKYLLEFSGRYNGSSRFAPDSRWGFFPSGSAGYNIAEENFWTAVKPYVNRLKVRFSYGALGNENVDNYLYIQTIPVGNETPWIIGGERPPYANVPGILSNTLTWETITTMNFGIDAGFLDDRLSLTFDLYNRKTTNMFGPQVTLPYTLGTAAPKTNNASLETKGFELLLAWRDKLSDNFSYNVQLGLGDSRSKILNYVNESGFIDDWYEGKEVGEIWGYVSDGLIHTTEEAKKIPDQSSIYPNWRPGDMRYKDINGDGKITEGNRTLKDHGDLKILGNNAPRYNINLTGGFNWKGFDFYMQWSGIGKRDYFPPSLNVTFWGAGTSWSNTAMLEGSPSLDYWRPADETNFLGPNTDAYFPKPYASSETYKNRVVQSKYLLNAAYVRLKFLQVGYTIPSNISKKAFIQKARVYISGTNLLTIKSLPQAMDPVHSEMAFGNGAFYPFSRSLSIGLNLTF